MFNLALAQINYPDNNHVTNNNMKEKVDANYLSAFSIWSQMNE